MSDHARVLTLLEAFPGRSTVTIQKLSRELAGLPSNRTKQILSDLTIAGHISQVDRAWKIRRSQIIGPDALSEYRIMGGLAVDRLIDAQRCGQVEWRGAARSVRQVVRHRLHETLRHKVIIIPIDDFLADIASTCRPPAIDDLTEYLGSELEGYTRFDHLAGGEYSTRWREPDGHDGVYRLYGRQQNQDKRPRWLWHKNGQHRILEADQGQLLCYHLAGAIGTPVAIPFYHERSLLMASWLPRAVYQCLIALGAERIASEPTAEKKWVGFTLPRGQVQIGLGLIKTMLSATIEDL